MAKRTARSMNPASKRRRIMRRTRVRTRTLRRRPTPSSGLPNQMLMKHKWVFGAVSTGITSTPHTRFFRLNSLFDPYQTGTNHQPYYFDQMAALYARYTVMACKVIVRAACTAGAGIVGMKAQPDTTAIGAADNGCERPEAVYKFVSAGARPAVLSRYWSINRLFGVSKSAVRDEDNFGSGVASDPTNEYYLQLFAQSPDDTTSLSISYSVEMIFYARWSERIRVGAS